MNRPRPKRREEKTGLDWQVSQALDRALASYSLPFSEDAERALLSCFLHSPALLNQNVPAEYFYHGATALLYGLLKESHDKGIPIEYIAITHQLTQRGLMEKVGGNGSVAELLDFVPTPTHFSYYLSILRDLHVQRKVVQTGLAMVVAGYGSQIEDLAAKASEHLSLITEAARGKREKGMEEQLDAWMEDWDLMASGRRQSALPSRWEVWNAKGLGIQPGYHVILGPRGSGKSILLQNLLCDAAFTHQRPSMLFSFEMPVRMVLNRIIADMGNIHAGYLFSPDLTHPGKEVKQAILKCLEVIRKSKLQIIHDVSLSAEQIAGMARALKAKEGDCIVGLDYLQLLPDPKGRALDLREQMIAHNSSVFRNLSKALDIPVYALSQINKDGTSRESNAPEQDADTVVRVERYRLPDGSMKENGIEITKARNGPDGNVALKLKGEFFRFVEDTTPHLP